MSTGFGELLKQKPAPTSTVTSQIQANEDNTVARYRLYSQLYNIGTQKDRDYVRSIINTSELVHVVKVLMPNDPRVVALDYIIQYIGEDKATNAITALLRDVRSNLEDWLRLLIDIATGEAK